MLCQSSNYLRWYAKQSQMSSQIFGGVTMNNQTKCIDSHGGRCVSQRRRGLGFSDLHSFNLVVLAKQCRQMIQNHMIPYVHVSYMINTIRMEIFCVGERSNFKIFLRTRKIMVMHSNERGECRLHTLVDRKRKR